jgi:biotin operon repressor
MTILYKRDKKKLKLWRDERAIRLLSALSHGEIMTVEKLAKRIKVTPNQISAIVSTARNQGHDIWYVQGHGYQLARMK